MADEDDDFTPEPGAEFVWMRHEHGGNAAQFPVASVPMWRRIGWAPCEPPDPYDPTMAEYQPPRPAPAEEPGPAADDTSETTSEGVSADA